MIVHFVVDEKIIDQIIDNFLKLSNKHIFLVFRNQPSKPYEHITRKGDFIRDFNHKTEDINNVLNSLNAKAIILHQLNNHFSETINKVNSSIKISWVAWGFEIYSWPKLEPTLYAPKTNRFLNNYQLARQIKSQVRKNTITRKLYYKFIKRKTDPTLLFFSALKKINYFCTYIAEDFEYFTQHFKVPQNISFFESAFCTIDQYLAGNKNSRINNDASNILIGNSNTLESNYLDVISKLKLNKENLNRIFIVLSYGKNKKHKEKVIKEGNSQLGNKFYPLTDFMPRKQYIEMLQSCSVGIFNHYRQQAMGNIIALLYMGARVYLSEKNPAYHYFLRK
jgi:hypothetical protein